MYVNNQDSLADCSRTTGEAVRLFFGEKAEAGTISCVLNLSFIPYPVVFLSIWLKMWYNKEKRGGSTVQLKYHMLTIEDLVPVGHFLRKLEAVLDLSFVYEETAGLYSRKYGRPPIDPVVLVKYLLVSGSGYCCIIAVQKVDGRLPFFHGKAIRRAKFVL